MGMTEKTNLAIDIDGVICDWQGHLKKLVDEHLEPETQDYLTDWDKIREVKDLKTGRTIASFAFKEWLQELHSNSPVLGDPLPVIETLKEHFNIHYVTHRLPTRETAEWLLRHGFRGELMFKKNKLDAPCPVIVDDYSVTLRDYERRYRIAICFDQPWNRMDNFKYRIHEFNQLPEALRQAGIMR